MGRKAAVAPEVVVQTSRRQQVLWFVLLLAGLLLAAWHSCDHGRRQGQGGDPGELAQGRDSAQRIAPLAPL